MHILAPAKVNLFLRIVGQRHDGYRLLDSLTVPVSLCDDIKITVQAVQAEKTRPRHSTQISLSCDDPSIPSDETNLAYRAASLVCQEAQLAARIALHIAKRIPAGAGLGGGSSDAAAVLKGLNTEFGLGWTESQLCILGAKLGADVPFFIPCQPAHVGGIGEELTPVSLAQDPSNPLNRWLVLVVPPFGVSTPWAYRRFDELSITDSDSVPVVSIVDQSWSGRPGWPVPGDCVNDLESAVLPAHPAIQEIKDALLACQADVALMSGSGSAVFGIFPHQQAAQQAGEAMAKKGRVFLVQPLAGAPSVSTQGVE